MKSLIELRTGKRILNMSLHVKIGVARPTKAGQVNSFKDVNLMHAAVPQNFLDNLQHHIMNSQILREFYTLRI